MAAQIVGGCLVCLLPLSTAFSSAGLLPSAGAAACASAPCSAFVRGQARAEPRRPVGPAFTRTRCGQGTTAARMGVLRVITPEEIPVDCAEPVDPGALKTAQAVIKAIRSASSARRSRRTHNRRAGACINTAPAGPTARVLHCREAAQRAGTARMLTRRDLQ